MASSSSPAIIQGFLLKKAMNSGKNWKRRYFTLTMSGELSYADKKGAPPKKTIKITKTTQIDVLRELGEDGISITGPGHNPLYLQAESAEVAEGWIQALNIVKNGKAGRAKGAKDAGDEARKGEHLRAAFANKSALGSSGRGVGRKGTLTKKPSGKQMGSVRDSEDSLASERAGPGSGSASGTGSSGTLNRKGRMPPAAPPKKSLKDVTASAGAVAPPSHDVDSSDDDGEGASAAGGATEFPDGFMMRIGERDYFVDAQGWEYYESRQDFLNGKKPKGTAVLSILV